MQQWGSSCLLDELWTEVVLHMNHHPFLDSATIRFLRRLCRENLCTSQIAGHDYEAVFEGDG